MAITVRHLANPVSGNRLRITATPREKRHVADITRRQWLGGAVAAGAAFTIVPRHVLGGANHTAPSDKLALAGIGIGGIGFPQLQACEGRRLRDRGLVRRG
jgi:hypothetical protein